jgi:hypothetical protein
MLLNHEYNNIMENIIGYLEKNQMTNPKAVFTTSSVYVFIN